MFCASIRITKSKIYIAFFSIVLIIIFAVVFSAFAKGQSFDGTSDRQRINFIESLGYKVDGEASAVEIVVPKNFGDVYLKYNEVQIAAGFNLENFKGEKVTVYTYPISGFDENVNAHLLVFNGKIVGGDISSTKLDGFMNPLVNISQINANE